MRDRQIKNRAGCQEQTDTERNREKINSQREWHKDKKKEAGKEK